MDKSNFNIRFIKLFLTLFFLILFTTTIFILRSCRRKKTITSAQILAKKAYAKAKKKNPKPQPEIVLKETSLYMLGKNNIKTCKIKAQKSKMFPDNNEIECSNVICKFNTNKNKIATLTAKKAYINNETIRLKNGVTSCFEK